MADSINMFSVVDSIERKAGTASELLVLDVDARVHHVAKGAIASTVIVDIGCAWLSPVGDTAQTPWSIVL